MGNQKIKRVNKDLLRIATGTDSPVANGRKGPGANTTMRKACLCSSDTQWGFTVKIGAADLFVEAAKVGYC